MNLYYFFLSSFFYKKGILKFIIETQIFNIFIEYTSKYNKKFNIN